MAAAIVELPEDERQYQEPIDEDVIDGDADSESIWLDPESEEFIHELTVRILVFAEEFCNVTLFPYQRDVGYRIIQSVLLGDGEEITVLQARQSGKSETLACVIVAIMVLLPRLAKAYPELLGKFAKGCWVGVFAPTELQAETVWSRVHDRLTGEQAVATLGHPEMDDKATKSGGKAKTVTLKNSGSLCRMQTANPKAKIESKSYHFVLVDEAQECFKAVVPVLTSDGWVPIGEIVNGPRRDWKVASQECGELRWVDVVQGFKTKRSNHLVRVVHEYGSVECTANHPFIVGDERVPAGALAAGEVLSVVPGSLSWGGEAAPEAGNGVLFDVPHVESSQGGWVRAANEGAAQPQGLEVDDREQPHAERGVSQEDERDIGAQRPPAPDTWGEWTWVDGPAGDPSQGAWVRVDGRVCRPHWTTGEGRPSVALQDRSGPAGGTAGGGSRRDIALQPQGTGSGREEVPVAVESRVVRVEVLEQGSDGVSEGGGEGDYVYTLQVDSESHTYVAGGVVVGNCDDFIVQKSISPTLAFYNGTKVFTGTPNRTKNFFYNSIRYNKTRQTKARQRQNHFEYNYKTVIKYNPDYKKFVMKERARLGEDSDEFQMSYACLDPSTKVLTADLRYVPIGELQVGDKLVGFDEHRPSKGQHRKLKETVVTKTARISKQGFLVRLDDGKELRCSYDHQWLVLTAGGRTVWKHTEDLAITDRIFKIADEWGAPDDDYMTGYLAAAYDGEGHCVNTRSGQIQLGFSQKENAMLAKVREFLTVKGFDFWESKNEVSGVVRINLNGGRATALRFLGLIRPERLLTKLTPDKWGSIGRHDHIDQQFKHPRVTAVEPLGEIEVVPLETSSRTYIAEGLASHNCRWMLEQGMFVTEDRLDQLADPGMGIVKSWYRDPIVIGIDPARTTDSTVCTAMWVDWNSPDRFGFFEHRVLNWLEIHNKPWEEQYALMYDFISSYNVLRIGVDAQGMGSAVAERIQAMFPDIDVVPCTSDSKNQSERWKHLLAIIERGMFIYPGAAQARRTRSWKRFKQQMVDLEKKFQGPYMLAEAPDVRGAHDDYPDSAALAAVMTIEDIVEEIEVIDSPFTPVRRR